MKCKNCKSKSIKKDGFRKTKAGTFQRFKCKECNYNFTSEQKFMKQKIKKISRDPEMPDIKIKLDIKTITNFRQDNNYSLRKIARIYKVALSTLQYFIKHNEE